MKTNCNKFFCLNSQHNIRFRKLILLPVLFFTFFIYTLNPMTAAADYNIYLENGKIISGADDVVYEAGSVKISKYGIVLELQESSVIKIEKYDVYNKFEEEILIDPSEDKKVIIQPPENERLPEYLEFNKESYERQSRAKEQQNRLELGQTENQLQSVLNRLKHIETLKKKSEDLGWRIQMKSAEPRIANIAREEKAIIDKQLESLNIEKDSLLKQKNDLERKIKKLRRY